MLYQTMSSCIVGKQFYFGFKLPSQKKKTTSSPPPHSTLKQVLSHLRPGDERACATDGLVAYQVLTPTLSVLKPNVVDLLRCAHEKKPISPVELRNVTKHEISMVQQTCERVAHQQHADESRKSMCSDSHVEQSANMTNEMSDFGSSSHFSLGLTLLEVTCDMTQGGSSSSNISQAGTSSDNVSQAGLPSANVSQPRPTSTNTSQAGILSDNISHAGLSSTNICQTRTSSDNLSQAGLSSNKVSQAGLPSANISQAGPKSTASCIVGNNNQTDMSSTASLDEQMQQYLCNKTIHEMDKGYKTPRTERDKISVHDATCTTINSPLRCNCQNVCRCSSSNIENFVQSSQCTSVKEIATEKNGNVKSYKSSKLSPALSIASTEGLVSHKHRVSSTLSPVDPAGSLSCRHKAVSYKNKPTLYKQQSNAMQSCGDFYNGNLSEIPPATPTFTPAGSLSYKQESSSFKTKSTPCTRWSNSIPSCEQDVSPIDDVGSENNQEHSVYVSPSASKRNPLARSLKLGDNAVATSPCKNIATNETFIESSFGEKNHTQTKKEINSAIEEDLYFSPSGLNISNNQLQQANVSLKRNNMSANPCRYTASISKSFTESSVRENAHFRKENNSVDEEVLNASTLLGADLPLSEDFELFLQQIEAQYAGKKAKDTADKVCKNILQDSNKQSMKIEAQYVSEETKGTGDKTREDILEDSSKQSIEGGSVMRIQATHFETRDRIKDPSIKVQAYQDLCGTKSKLEDSVVRIHPSQEGCCETANKTKDSNKKDCDTESRLKDSIVKIHPSHQEDCDSENNLKVCHESTDSLYQKASENGNDSSQNSTGRLSQCTSPHNREHSYEDSMSFDTSGLSYTGSQDLFSQSYKEYQTAVNETFLKSHSTPLDEMDRNEHVIDAKSNRKSLLKRHSILMQSALGTPLLFSQDSISAVSPLQKQNEDCKLYNRRSILAHVQLKTKPPGMNGALHTPANVSSNRERRKRTHSSNLDSQKINQESAYKSCLYRRSISTPNLFTQEDSHLLITDNVGHNKHKTSMESYCLSFDGTLDLFSPGSEQNSYYSHLNKGEVDLRKKLF